MIIKIQRYDRVRAALVRAAYYASWLVPAHRRLDAIVIEYRGLATVFDLMAQAARGALLKPGRTCYYEFTGGTSYGAWLKLEETQSLFDGLVQKLGFKQAIVARHHCRSGRLDYHVLAAACNPQGRFRNVSDERLLQTARCAMRRLVADLNRRRLDRGEPTIANFNRKWRVYFAEPEPEPAKSIIPQSEVAAPSVAAPAAEATVADLLGTLADTVADNRAKPKVSAPPAAAPVIPQSLPVTVPAATADDADEEEKRRKTRLKAAQEEEAIYEALSRAIFTAPSAFSPAREALRGSGFEDCAASGQTLADLIDGIVAERGIVAMKNHSASFECLSIWKAKCELEAKSPAKESSRRFDR